MRIGSLFSGYGGLEMGVQSVVGGSVAWHCEYDAAPSKILAHHWPDVPNLGDITAVDWADVEPVDVLTGGSPCQDVSAAGRRAGMRPGTRSGLWESMREGIAVIRPRLVVWENVRGVTSAEAHSDMEPCPGCVGGGDDGPVLRALGRVLGDLADLGYDARWYGLRAADVGAPHGRFRIFVAATDTANIGHERRGPARNGRTGPADGRGPVADADDAGRGEPRWAVTAWPELSPAERARLTAAYPDGDAVRQQPVTQSRSSGAPLTRLTGATATYPEGDGWDERRTEPTRLIGGPDAALRSDAPTNTRGRRRKERVPELSQPEVGVPTWGDPDGRDRAAINWGQYEPAIRRWERALGRPAPAPTEPGTRGNQRLSPKFVEWMMGLPVGHVTDPAIGISRNEQLKALGNGVVPAQAAAALTVLLNTAEVAA
jgi:DNA (cytosine-5)-methyltransferase 1